MQMNLWGLNNFPNLGPHANDVDAAAFATSQGYTRDSMIYWNTTLGCYRIYDGTNWVCLAIRKVDYPIFEWLLFNGAVASTLNGGEISTSKLPKVSVDPGIQFKVALNNLIASHDLIIELTFGHSTLTQTLDLDLNYVSVGAAENLDTKASAPVLNITPVTPGTAYQKSIEIFTVPHAQISDAAAVEFRLSRDTAGADTGDLEIWNIRAYQIG